MSAISVLERKSNIVHVTASHQPSLDQVPDGRGVLVKVLRLGLHGTDRETGVTEYEAAHPGYDFLVLGHEGFGQVEAVGPNVTQLNPGDYVVTSSRRPGRDGSISRPGSGDGGQRANFRRSFLNEYYVDDAYFTVKVPEALRHVGGLLEPSATGSAAISGNTSAMIFQAVVDGMPVSPLHLNPRLPWRLEEIISRLLKKDGRLRYQSARDIRSEVARLKRSATAAGIRVVKATLAWRKPGARWHFSSAGVFAY
jgi:alcohol dehydrogenase-like protein